MSSEEYAKEMMKIAEADMALINELSSKHKDEVVDLLVNAVTTVPVGLKPEFAESLKAMQK